MENLLTGMEPDFVPRYKVEGQSPAAAAARQRIFAGQQLFAADHAAAMAGVWRRFTAEPGRLAWWYLGKPARFWTWSIFQGQGDIYVYPMRVAPFDANPALRVLASLCHGLNPVIMLAAFAACILYLVQRKRWGGTVSATAGVAVALFAYATLLHTVLNPDARYAVPFRPFEFLLAALAASSLLTTLLKRRVATAAEKTGTVDS
jgi:hypothetical protein